MKPIVRLCAVLALSLAALLAVPASAKGPVDMLTIEGPGLATPVEITDEATRLKFGPGSRYFIAWYHGIVPPPPAAAPAYTVSFYLEGRKIYVLEYTPDPSGGPGSIYLPGPEHPAYQRNVEYVLTDGNDPWNPNGQWHYATPEWEAMVERAVQAHQAAPPASGPGGADVAATLGQAPLFTVSRPQPWTIPLMAVGLMAGLALVAWRSRRHRTS